MADLLVPLRWPDTWEPPAGSPFNCYVVEGTQSGAPVAEGVRVVTGTPDGVKLVRGSKPGIQGQGDGGEAGPTGKPWVNANGWRVQLEYALGAEAVWTSFEPGAELPFYLRAIADAAVYGGHWVVELNERDALEAWPRVTAAVRFFEQHREWGRWESVAALGIQSKFDDFGQETLNLFARRTLPVRILPAGRKSSTAGLKAVAVLDGNPPEGFAGKVLAGKTWDDPYQMTADVHLWLGRELDVIRLYNGGSINANYTQSPDGRRGAVQLINYTGTAAAHDITVSLAKRWRVARIHSLERKDAIPVKPVEVRFGIEIPLPAFGVYSAIELEA